MVALREVAQPEDSPALAASMAAEAFTVAGAAMAAEATDSLHEEITHETRNDEHD